MSGSDAGGHEIVMDVDHWECQDCWELGESATCPVLRVMPPATAEDIADWYWPWLTH